MTTNAMLALEAIARARISPRASEPQRSPAARPRAAATTKRRVQPTPHPDFAPASLVTMWRAHRAGISCACPDCPAGGALPLGLAVHAAHPAYRLQCSVCGWRSSWFEALADGRLLAIWLDVA